MVEHVAARWRPLRMAQALLESVTAPTCGEHFTRRPLAASGFTVTEHRERLGGVIQRIDAIRSPSATPSATKWASGRKPPAQRACRE